MNPAHETFIWDGNHVWNITSQGAMGWVAEILTATHLHPDLSLSGEITRWSTDAETVSVAIGALY